jgi:alpha/beta superfamily hydrolase
MSRAIVASMLILAGAAASAPAQDAARGRRVVDRLLAASCAHRDGLQARRSVLAGLGGGGDASDLRRQLDATCVAHADRVAAARRPAPAVALFPATTTQPDGTLLQRQRVAKIDDTALDLVAYASSGLSVGALICYPEDGQRHSAVVHVHGGLGGVFDDPDGNMVQTCVDWAKEHGRAAIVPSLRGQDGGEGQAELCGGEADDVAAAAVLLRSLEMTDPERLGIVGGSIGGCVTLRAAAKIPNLKAVVAYVPPMHWRSFMEFHRTQWQPAVETRCDGTTYDWDVGGTTLADVFDTIACGHPECDDADYDARSPIPGLLTQTAPTLIVTAGADNVVPTEQQLLWPLLRQALGHPVDVYVVGPCDPVGTPAHAMDVLIHVPSAYHLLSANAISSGLLFLMQELDRPVSVSAGDRH